MILCNALKRSVLNAVFKNRLAANLSTSSNESYKPEKLSDSSIILQNGLSIMELPFCIKVINCDFEISNKRSSAFPLLNLKTNSKVKSMISNGEEKEMCLGFERCTTLKEVFDLLSICPESEVSPNIASVIISKIFDFENNLEHSNEGYDMKINSKFTILRTAMLKHLIDIICSLGKGTDVIETFTILRQDLNEIDQINYLQPIFEKVMLLVFEKKLSPSQICEAAKLFYHFDRRNFVERLWIGFSENVELNEKEICDIVNTLPLLKESQSYVYNIVEDRIAYALHKLEPEHIMKIIYILIQVKINSHQMLSYISHWTNLNIHKLMPGNLRWIVYAFSYFNYTDKNIEKALSRYLKAKRSTVKDNSLISIIFDYCKNMRIRNTLILGIGYEYMLKHGKEIPFCHFPKIVQSLGHLMFVSNSQNSEVFLKMVEDHLMMNFTTASPKTVLEVVLSCMYLNFYPNKIVPLIFNLKFLNNLSKLDDRDLYKCREILYLLDLVSHINSNVNFEVNDMTTNSLFPEIYDKDERFTKVTDKVLIPKFIEIFGDNCKIMPLVCIPNLCNKPDVFLIDCLLQISKTFQYSTNARDNSSKINFIQTNESPIFLKMKAGEYAILIFSSENFDLSENFLLGPAELKKRIIEHFGYKVIALRYEIIDKLQTCPEKLNAYLIGQFV